MAQEREELEKNKQTISEEVRERIGDTKGGKNQRSKESIIKKQFASNERVKKERRNYRDHTFERREKDMVQA